MNITLVNTHDNNGGASIAALRLQKALTQNTDTKSVMLVQDKTTQNPVVIPFDNRWWGKKKAFLRFVLERLYFLPHEKSKEIRFLFNISKFGVNITSHQVIKNADIIHLHWINFGFLSVNSLKKLFATKKPVIWTLHDMWAFTGGCHHSGDCENFQQSCGNCKFLKNPTPNDLSNQVWKAKKSTYLGQNLTIVTCSKWLGDRAKKSSLFSGISVINIPNPIDVSVFKPLNKVSARTALGINSDKKYILFAAMRVDAVNKGFTYFKESLELLKDLLRENQLNDVVELLILGQTTGVEMNDLPFKATILGRISEVEKIVNIYSASSLFITPSLEENLPNTIMESMACGTPAIGFKIGGIPEMIDHEENGYLADYKSAQALAKGMFWILFHENYENLCQNARQKVLDNYSEKVVSQQYQALYDSLI